MNRDYIWNNSMMLKTVMDDYVSNVGQHNRSLSIKACCVQPGSKLFIHIPKYCQTHQQQ